VNIFGVGTTELLVILVIAMLVVGPERMVTLARDAGRALAKFRQITESVTKEFRETFSLEELEAESNGTGSSTVAGETTASQTVVDGSARVVGETVPALEVSSPEVPAELLASEAAQLEANLACGLVDGEIEVNLPVEMVASEGEPGQDGESLVSLSVEPVAIEVAELVPEDAEVEPVDVGQVVLVPDEDGADRAVEGEG